MSPASSSSSKPELRTAALGRRDALSPDERFRHAREVASRAAFLPVAAGALVAGYSPIRSELDPAPLMQALAHSGARLCLPCVTSRDAPLTFRSWTQDVPLVRGAFGILQPGDDAPEVLPDVVLVPLAAFDRRGHRIGYGAGFYDRSLSRLRDMKPVLSVGLAFSVQEVPEVPFEPHDVPLDLVITDRQTFDLRE